MGSVNIRAWTRIRAWALWSVPRPVLIFVLAVCGVAVTVSAATATLVTIESSDVAMFAVLAVCAWIAIELTRHIERKREYWRSPTAGYIDTKSIWSFAAVIVLPPLLASVMVVLTYVIAWCRIKPHARPGMMYRWTFSCATVLCGTQAAVVVLALGMDGYPGAPGELSWSGLTEVAIVIIAAVLRWAINLGLIMLAVALSSPTARARDLFSNFGEQVLEAGALGLGMVTAAVVVHTPFVLPGIVVAMVALHRGLLVNQYEQASRTDKKTGLATAGWWHDFAEQALTRCRDSGSTMGVLVVDLDHFKVINDTYGHPYGDNVLQAVAEELLTEVRDQDACGRWGGEEFAVALPDIGNAENLFRVAERIRRRIQSIAMEPPGAIFDSEPVRLTASVGAALFPGDTAATLDELILAADTALYEAKHEGRNLVRLKVDFPDELPSELAGCTPEDGGRRYDSAGEVG